TPGGNLPGCLGLSAEEPVQIGADAFGESRRLPGGGLGGGVPRTLTAYRTRFFRAAPAAARRSVRGAAALGELPQFTVGCRRGGLHRGDLPGGGRSGSCGCPSAPFGLPTGQPVGSLLCGGGRAGAGTALSDGWEGLHLGGALRGRLGLRRRDDQRGGNPDVGGGAVEGAGLQLHVDALAGGESADDVEPHVPDDLFTQLRRGGEPPVELVEAVLGDADAVVDDLKQECSVLARPPADGDREVGRGVGGGVVQQFGDEVAEVVGGVGGDRHVFGEFLGPDPGVLADLGHRGADDVEQGDGVGVFALSPVAREDQQVLTVAPHPGGEVVDLEQHFQLFGVFFLAFELFDEGQ